MHFREEHIATFQQLFEEKKQLIRNREGCHHLELWQDTRNPAVFFTYSIWESEAYLDKYRYSDLFKTVWGLTKALFSEKAKAWSVIPKTVV